MDKTEEKRDAIFKKLDRRYEEHLANKETRKGEHSNQQSLKIVSELDESIVKITQKIDESYESAQSLPATEITLLLDNFSSDMQKLDAYLSEKAPMLAAYELKKLQSANVEMRAKFVDLQDKLQPKKKFGFKGNKKKTHAKPTIDNSKAKGDATATTLVNKVSADAGFGHTLKGRVGERIVVAQNDVDGKDVLVTELTDCTVIMTSGNPITLHLTKLENCKLFCGPIQTSVYLDGCNSCTFSLACQQLRAHSSCGTDIYLHVTSKCIIEDCKSIRVAPYNLEYSDLTKQFDKLSLNTKINNWDSLDDFNWLATDKPSPNWSIMPLNERLPMQTFDHQ